MTEPDYWIKKSIYSQQIIETHFPWNMLRISKICLQAEGISRRMWPRLRDASRWSRWTEKFSSSMPTVDKHRRVQTGLWACGGDCYSAASPLPCYPLLTCYLPSSRRHRYSLGVNKSTDIHHPAERHRGGKLTTSDWRAAVRKLSFKTLNNGQSFSFFWGGWSHWTFLPRRSPIYFSRLQCHDLEANNELSTIWSCCQAQWE